MIKDLDKKEELFFVDIKKVPTNEEWVKIGKPVIWLKVYDKDNIIIWEDRAYARLKLITPEGEAVAWDTAVVNDIITHNTLSEDEGVVAYVPYKRIR